MKKEIVKRIFDFLEEKEGKEYKQKGSFKWKIIFNEPITQEDLNVKGDLNLEGSEITSLPKGLKVGGNLSLYTSKIESLPEGLEVKGELIIKNTALLEYTDKELKDMVKPGFIKGEIIREW